MRKYIISYEISAKNITHAEEIANELTSEIGMSPVRINLRGEKVYQIGKELYEAIEQLKLEVDNDELHEHIKMGMLKLLTCYEEADFIPEEVLLFGRSIVSIESLLAILKEGGL